MTTPTFTTQHRAVAHALALHIFECDEPESIHRLTGFGIPRETIAASLDWLATIGAIEFVVRPHVVGPLGNTCVIPRDQDAYWEKLGVVA